MVRYILLAFKARKTFAMNRFLVGILLLDILQCLTICPLSAVVKDITRSLKVLHINSISQKANDQSQLFFDGEVEVFIDRRLHVWADHVFVDEKKQVLVARSDPGSAVIIEDNNFFILADRFAFDLLHKVGSAKNLRLHVDEGYFAAHKAEKLNDSDWQLVDMVYTACDAENPHWQIQAHHAMVRGNYFVKASGLAFHIGKVPVLWLPRFIFPIQGHSKSGFLIPRFTFDYEYGLGIRQDYYKYFSPHCDATFGIDWCDRKGVLFPAEFRWAQSSDSFMSFKGLYAVLRDRFLQKQRKIVKATERPYWITGKDFRQWPHIFGATDVRSLLRLDVGMDKRVGYHFFSSTNDVDDTFYNTLNMRFFWPKNLVSLWADYTKTSRKCYTQPTQEQKTFINERCCNYCRTLNAVKETEDRVVITQLPHTEWNTAYKNLANILFCRHDFFIDQALYRQQEIQRLYINSCMIKQWSSVPLSKADVMRMTYRGRAGISRSIFHNALSAYIEPTFQVASTLAQPHILASKNVLEERLFAQGAYRLFAEYGAEWALPEGTVQSNNGRFCYTIQPLFGWEFLPKFYQNNWYYFDKWDRAYPKNELACTIRNSWDIGKLRLDLDLKQGYDFYTRSDIFPLRRGVNQKHLLPFRYDFSCSHDNIMFGLNQEFEIGRKALLQSEVYTSLNVKNVTFGIGYLYQCRGLMKQRELLSNVPHFITVNLAVPLGEHATLSYGGQFYASQRSSWFLFDGIAPLIHCVRLDYDGHCWGAYIGFEEKKYKEYGIGRNECAVACAFRLDSLGSFAKKFRKFPQIIFGQ